MQPDLLGLAMAAGLVAALNPCGFAMLPAYLALVVSDAAVNRTVALGRAVRATAAMTLGFIAVFAAFGVLTIAVANTVQRYLPALTVLIGIGLIAVGGWLLSGRELRLRLPAAAVDGPGVAPTARMSSMFGYGVAYAAASLTCTVGPFLAVTAAGARSSSLLGAAAVYLAYAAGFALVVGTLAVAAALASTAVATRLRRVLPLVNRIGGAVVLLVGLYVAYYGAYELRLFHFGADPHDAVIAAAGRIQGTIAGWVHEAGALPWLLALAVLAGAAMLWRALRNWRRDSHRR